MAHYIRPLMAIGGLLALMPLRAEDRDPNELLQQVRAKVLASVNRALTYTCVQTVERKYYRSTINDREPSCPLVLDDSRDPAKSSKLQWTSTDRLRLEVTLTKGGELFSWAGDSRFDDRGIDSVVRDGPFGSGSFAAFLNLILWRDVKEFRYDGHKLLEGRDLMEYSFRVNELESHYRLKRRDSWETTGYFGSLFVEPETSDVARLQIETVPEIGSETCQTGSTLDFSTMEIAAAPFVLPTRARQIYLNPDRTETENISNFSNCREYRGESTIKFDVADGASRNDARNTSRPKVAGGQSFSLILLDPIDTRTAAAGDPFRARLEGTLRDGNNRVLAQTGATIEGRIRRVEIHASPAMVYLVLAPANAPDGIELAANRERTWRARGMEVVVPRFGEGAGGVFQLPGKNPVMPAGFQSDWRTVEVYGR